MAATKKKIVTKDDLRRFMKEKQSLSKVAAKRIEHPLAKYNSLNQLICIVCSNIIKNDLLWTAHIQSKQHKERVIALKTQGPVKPDHLSTPLKRKGDADNSLTDKKKLKTAGTANSESSVSQSDVRERAKAALLAGYSSSSSSDESDEDRDEDKITRESKKLISSDTSPSKSSQSSKNNLPDDFFDDDEPALPETSLNKKMSEVLPEGFFDDPKMDAKVRNVEYKDKDEEQWELFQKAIKEEAQVSEVIMEEEDEQVNIDRNIDEIDDQIQRWQEVEKLHVKKEIILKSSKSDGTKKAETRDDVEDDELDEFLDWRAKKSLK